MSCGKGDDGEPEFGEMPARRDPPVAAKCVKCRVQDVVFARQAARYCKECFVIALNRRFKDVAFPAREHCRAPKGSKNQKNGSLLLAYSGSPSSRMTLEFLKTLYFVPTSDSNKSFPAFSSLDVLHVKQPTETSDDIERMAKTVADYGFQLNVVAQEDVFADSSMAIDISTSNMPVQAVESASSLLDCARFTPTARSTLSTSILAAFVIDYATAHSHKAVMFCETATKLAAKTLSAISQGQGFALGELVGASSVPAAHGAVQIFRPLANINDEEVHFFAEQIQGWPAYNDLQQHGGIDGLVRRFVGNLEAGFPSTVSVISRTASKLGSRSIEKAGEIDDCALCGWPRDDNAVMWRKIASLSSFTPVEADDPSGDDHGSFQQSLCYGCLVPFLELQTSIKGHPADAEARYLSVPRYVAERRKPANEKNGASASDNADALRAQIEDCLL